MYCIDVAILIVLVFTVRGGGFGFVVGFICLRIWCGLFTGSSVCLIVFCLVVSVACCR